MTILLKFSARKVKATLNKPLNWRRISDLNMVKHEAELERVLFGPCGAL
jgi:hypothetical protein